MSHLNVEIKAKSADQDTIREILKSRKADFKGIDHFLRYRYNYWTDDIEHTDSFLSD